MVRLFLPSARLTDTSLSVTGEKAHYLVSVLRCRKGDNFIVFDGRGTCFLAEIREIGKRMVVADVLESFSCDFESPLHSILVQGILKGDKMDLVIRKTTELGISEIVPAETERSQLRDTRRVKRWGKIAEEAARQSGRNIVPVIHKPVDLMTYLSSPEFPATLQGFIFYEDGGISLTEACRLLNNARGNIHERRYTIQHIQKRKDKDRRPEADSVSSARLPLYILVGAEGGFTRDEVASAQERGLTVVSLGKRVLRAETAAISAVTLVQYLLGDMG